MGTEVESVCCRELDRVDRLRGDDDCITAHEMFAVAFLNIRVLQIMYFELLEERPEVVQAPEIHRSDIYIRLLPCSRP